MCSGNDVAIGPAADWLNYADTSFSLVQWHGVSEGWKEINRVNIELPKDKKVKDIYFRIDASIFQAKTTYSFDSIHWIKFGNTWGFVWETAPWRSYWSTFYPGIFAGSTMPGPNKGCAYFDYFKHTNYDRQSN